MNNLAQFVTHYSLTHTHDIAYTCTHTHTHALTRTHAHRITHSLTHTGCAEVAYRHTMHTTRGRACNMRRRIRPRNPRVREGVGIGLRVYGGHTRNWTTALLGGASASIENVNGDDERGRPSCPCPWPCPRPCSCTRSPLAPAAVCAAPGFPLGSLPPWPPPQSADQFEKGWEKPSMKTKRPWERGARGLGLEFRV